MNCAFHTTEISFGSFSFLTKDRLLCSSTDFKKKTQKTPLSEIEKAIKIMEEYYEYKRDNAD